LAEPRILAPCGETLCLKCIESSSSLNGELDCFFCQVKHPIPENGFTPNRALIKLLTMKPDEVYRNSGVEKLKENLNQIDALAHELKLKVQNSNLIVKQHCDQVVNAIDLITELKIEEINATRKDYLKQVASYETTCFERIKRADVLSFDTFAQEANAFAKESRHYLRDFKIQEPIVDERNQQAEKFRQTLEERLAELKRIQFNDMNLECKESRSPSSIGALSLLNLNEPAATGSGKYGLKLF
jgi:ribosome-associated translation inhibitor RaiA